ncbi:MAG: GNAT family N-acetyltransferase [Alphaproteobacteria bacterium]|nr:GNAT family N-acetyltransferase [Alphaproteobacteria bacterium]
MSVIIRSAVPSDLPHIVQTHSLSAMQAYGGHISPAVLEATFSLEKLHANWARSFQQKAERGDEHALFVAERASGGGPEIVGVARCHVVSDAAERSFVAGVMGRSMPRAYGEVQTLYVHPRHQGFGVGHFLMSAMGGHLLKQGAAQAVVVTLGGYSGSSRFYQSVGGALHGGRFEQDVAAASGAVGQKTADCRFDMWFFPDVRRFATPICILKNRLASDRIKREEKERACI